MPRSNIRAAFPCEVERVWKIVTDLSDWSWRSDLSRIETAGDGQFIEYTTEGYPTTFTVTAMEPCRRWEFDMDNTNMHGHWTGTFVQNGANAEVSFTEDVTAKKLLLKPFVRTYLKKQQANYMRDLKKALERPVDP